MSDVHTFLYTVYTRHMNVLAGGVPTCTCAYMYCEMYYVTYTSGYIICCWECWKGVCELVVRRSAATSCVRTSNIRTLPGPSGRDGRGSGAFAFAFLRLRKASV